MHVIPVTLATIDIVTALEGSIPDPETVGKFYVYEGKDKPSRFLAGPELEEWPEEEWTIVQMMWKPEQA